MPAQIDSLKTASANVLKLAIPFALADLMDVARNYVGNILLAKQGSEYLAAGALMSSMQLQIFAFAVGALYSVGILIKDAQAEQKDKKIGCILQQSVVFALLISAAAAPAMIFSGAILTAEGQPQHLALIAQSYMRRFLIGLPAMLTMVSLQQFALAINKSAVVILSSAWYMLVCSGTAALLINGAGMAEDGLAYANVIAAYTTLFAILIYFRLSKDIQKYQLFARNNWSDAKNILLDLFHKGKWIGMQIGLEVSSILGLTLITGIFGKTALAAEQITLQYMFLLLVPLYSIGQASGILCREQVVQRDQKAAQLLGKSAHLIAASFSAAAALVFGVARKQLISLFSRNTQIDDISQTLIAFMVVGQIFDSLRGASGGCLRGYLDTRAAMISSFVGLVVVGLPVGYALSAHAGLNVAGMFVGRTIGLAGSSLFMGHRWFKEMRKPLSPPQSLELMEAPPAEELTEVVVVQP